MKDLDDLLRCRVNSNHWNLSGHLNSSWTWRTFSGFFLVLQKRRNNVNKSFKMKCQDRHCSSIRSVGGGLPPTNPSKFEFLTETRPLTSKRCQRISKKKKKVLSNRNLRKKPATGLTVLKRTQQILQNSNFWQKLVLKQLNNVKEFWRKKSFQIEILKRKKKKNPATGLPWNWPCWRGRTDETIFEWHNLC